jgi:hypothetical protein
MSKHNHESNHVRRIAELIMIVLTVSGGGCLVLSLLLRDRVGSSTLDILRSAGLAFFPTGIVSYLLTRYAGDVTDQRITEAVKRTIGDRFEKHIEELSREVIKSLSAEWKTNADLLLDEVRKAQTTVATGIKAMESQIAEWSPLTAQCFKLGVQGVYLTRTGALEAFNWFLDAEIRKAHRKEPARIWFVCSSIKGFMTAATADFNGRKTIQLIVQSGCDLHILMTDPSKADLRASQEGRASGEIPDEIKVYLANFKRLGIKRECIKFYPGTPTVFGIATTERILLNPYPYETQAFECFSLIVQKTIEAPADIFSQYWEFHFNRPWEKAVEIAQSQWDALR